MFRELPQLWSVCACVWHDCSQEPVILLFALTLKPSKKFIVIFVFFLFLFSLHVMVSYQFCWDDFASLTCSNMYFSSLKHRQSRNRKVRLKNKNSHAYISPGFWGGGEEEEMGGEDGVSSVMQYKLFQTCSVRLHLSGSRVGFVFVRQGDRFTPSSLGWAMFRLD